MRPLFLTLLASVLLGACGPAPDGQVAEAASPDQQTATSASAFPPLTGRVVDRAELLTADQEAGLTGELAELERRTTDQLVIVTVPSLGERPIEDYARDLGNHWGVGQAEKDNGVLIVVAPSERKVRIEVGHGLEPILTNARASEIIDSEMLPRFRESRWHAGIEAGARSIVATLIAHERAPRLGRP